MKRRALADEKDTSQTGKALFPVEIVGGGVYKESPTEYKNKFQWKRWVSDLNTHTLFGKLISNQPSVPGRSHPAKK